MCFVVLTSTPRKTGWFLTTIYLGSIQQQQLGRKAANIVASAFSLPPHLNLGREKLLTKPEMGKEAEASSYLSVAGFVLANFVLSNAFFRRTPTDRIFVKKVQCRYNNTATLHAHFKALFSLNFSIPHALYLTLFIVFV